MDPEEDEKESKEECEHSFVLKDDIGSVCRICGVVNKSIETIIEYQYTKVSFFFCYQLILFYSPSECNCLKLDR